MDGLLAVFIVLTPIIVVMIQVYGYRDSVKRTTALEVKSDEIHVLVNSRLTEALTRIKSLEKALNIEDGDPIPEH